MEEHVTLDVAGLSLEARLAAPAGARAGLVVCHPHPLYGGDMDNPVVTRAAEVAREVGLATLRFNFRGVGTSTGTHDKGVGEQDDVRAALATLGGKLLPGRLIGLAGYSFGAWVASRVAAQDTGVSALGLIAPPLAMLPFDVETPGHLDVMLVAGTRDQYCPLAEFDRLAARLPPGRAATIDGADHFFFGKLYPLGEAVRGWLLGWAGA
jgi:alpha/beta superfamily hydrolase